MKVKMLVKKYIFLILLLFFNSAELKAEEKKSFIKIGGFVDTSSASVGQSGAYENEVLPNSESTLKSVNRQNIHGSQQSRVFSRIDLTAGIKVDEVRSFGVKIVLNSTIGNNEDDAGRFGNQNYIFLNTKYGRQEIGVSPTPAATMRIDASVIARASGGIGGQWFRFVNFPVFNTSGMSADQANELSAGYMPIFLLQPMLPNEAGFTSGATQSLFIYQGNDQANPQMTNGGYDVMYYNRQQPRFGHALHNGINFYTPRYNGFQFGFSYGPNTGSAGGIGRHDSEFLRNGSGNPISIHGANSTRSGNVANYLSMGVNYKKILTDDIDIALSLTHERGQAQDINNPYGVNGGCTIYSGSCINGFNGRRDLSAYAIGGKLNYGPFSFAGSYGSWGNSLQPIANNAKDGSGNYLYPWLVPFDANGNEMVDFKKTSFYNFGGAYEFGPFNASVTHLVTNNMGNKVNASSIGLDYQVSGYTFGTLVPYIEYTQFSMTGAPIYLASVQQLYTPIKNSGNVIMIGFKFIF
jgi:hypothetical protein